MKLRIHENSIRLRLNRSEVTQLAETGRVENTLEFGPSGKLSYTVETVNGLESARAAFVNGDIRVKVPAGVAREWAATDRVEISGTQPGRGGAELSILVEKDFKCIHNDSKDEEAFPNPLAAAH
jgi:uncharacterized protein DUF7009